MEDDVREVILATTEAALAAQLRAVRSLRRQGVPERRSRKRGMSQVDMAHDILLAAGGQALHIQAILDGIHSKFGVRIDRESLVSSLSKKVARGDRFVRTARNTYALAGE